MNKYTNFANITAVPVPRSVIFILETVDSSFLRTDSLNYGKSMTNVKQNREYCLFH